MRKASARISWTTCEDTRESSTEFTSDCDEVINPLAYVISDVIERSGLHPKVKVMLVSKIVETFFEFGESESLSAEEKAFEKAATDLIESMEHRKSKS